MKQLGFYTLLALGLGLWIDCSSTLAQTSAADSVDSTNLQPEIIPAVDRLAEVLPSAADSVDSTNLQPEIIPSVDRLADVLPSSWAFSAVRSLVEKYGCIAGGSEKRFRGEQALSRQEFAVALNACLERIDTIDRLTRDDLMAVERLQQAFTERIGLKPRRSRRLFFSQIIDPLLYHLGHRFFLLLRNPPQFCQSLFRNPNI